jgi:MoxR-like ATPase
MAFAMPSADSISNLASAQQSLSTAQQAYDNWKARYEQNEDDLRQALARQAALNEEKHKREQDVAEGTKHLHETWMAMGRPAPPAALPASPSPPTSAKRLTAAQKAAMTPEERKAHKAAKKLAHDERKAHRTPEEQAKIDAKVAKMQAALAASRAAKKALAVASEEPAGESV